MVLIRSAKAFLMSTTTYVNDVNGEIKQISTCLVEKSDLSGAMNSICFHGEITKLSTLFGWTTCIIRSYTCNK